MPTDQELIRIVPSDRQLAYQETEFYAFFHFGMNTYTDREWGDGTEDPKLLTLPSWMPTSGYLQPKAQA